MDRLDAMRAFVTVAEQASFAEAARRLRLSPAAVTRTVAQLEGELGLLLMARTTRSVRLTERGAIYLESCRRILADLDDADRLVMGEDAAPRGQMVVAAPLMFGRLHVLPIVVRLLHDHPALSVRLSLSDRFVHLVEDGVDVAVRIGELADSALVAVRLGTVRRVLVASPAYLGARGRPASPAELAKHDLVSFEGMERSDTWHFGRNAPPVRVAPRLAVNTADAALAAAEDGLGITRTLSYQAQAGLSSGRLVRLLAEFDPPEMPIHAVHPARRIGSANIAAFVIAARSHFRLAPLAELALPPDPDRLPP
jgi:DNA-binding transcriptional LysR family regulator